MKITIVDETKTFDKKTIEQVQKNLQETFRKLNGKGKRNENNNKK